ncbi:MAG: recombinase family protein [Pseudomonadota bacterium]
MTRIRCAIYTRKSSDEGLDQSFNSLDAQREACSAYIKSQRHEGWRELKAHYDDGGHSGGTIERPALKRLLEEVDAGRINMVVVYKIDRLTRSLTDFAKLVDRLDEANASFVSVTQQFNTSTSMGRLTLNVLLSFAQFEREVTAERIRDKIAASKKKGMWMGGLVPLGYDKSDTGLIINRNEAEIVRTAFQSYLEVGCVRRLKEHFDAAGWYTKTRTLKDGRLISGKPFSRGRLYHLLSNAIYIGKIQHKDKLYDGRHEAIIDDELWTSVQQKLKSNAVARKSGRNHKNPSPLAGKVFDQNGNPLTPNHANKAGKRYRYYVYRSGMRLPASEIEQGVLAALHSDRNVTLYFEQKVDRSPTDTELFESVSRVDVQPGQLSISIQLHRARTVTALFTLRRRGVENRVALNPNPGRAPDYKLIKRVLAAMSWTDGIKSGASIAEVAAAQKVSPEYITHNIGLALLSPKILQAIIDGKQRSDISAYQLSKVQIPATWEDQNPLFMA